MNSDKREKMLQELPQTVMELLAMLNNLNERVAIIEDRLKIKNLITAWKCVNCGKLLECEGCDNPNNHECSCGSESWEPVMTTVELDKRDEG
jgi:hypothetical protein